MTWQEIKSKYTTGSIYNLQVETILTDHQLILFKIEDYDCRLHVSNIANEPELSKKLFSVIKVGDFISVAITDFNDEKQNVNLSTKVFRNYLDDVLSFTKSKKIIENERKEHLSLPDRYLSMHRNMLDRLRGDLSSNELTFLYELIQNAVDHPNRNFNDVSITFEIFNNYLLVKHNGSLFTENNFKSITGILAGEQVNENERERIGYKGIGFKSVYRYSHNVYIRSGNFSFSFNKNSSAAEMPWEVLPIFQLEKDKVEEIQQFNFFNVPVAFAIELIDEELKKDVIKYLKQLSQNPYLLLFLENLVRLEIIVPDDYYCLEKEIEKTNNFDVLTLRSNGVTEGKYLTISKEYEITNPEVIAELLDENVTAIPSKMRNFRKPKVSIALPLENQTELINFFTYLPLSNTKLGLPYIINADFIPDLDRTNLVNNLKYNSEVLKFASDALLSFSQVLINEGKYSDFLKLIPAFKKSNNTALGIIADNYYENSTILELPDNENTKIKKENVVIDKTGVFKIIDEKFINEIEKYKGKFILSSKINDDDEKIHNYLNVVLFDETDLITLFNLESFKDKYLSNSKNLINILFKTRHIISSKKIHSILTSKVPSVNIDDDYYFLKELTIKIPEQFKVILEFLDLFIPYPEFLENIIIKHSNIRSLLENLKINAYDSQNAINLIANNIQSINKKLSILPNEDKGTIKTKISNLNNLWLFILSNKNVLDDNNNNLINNRFSDLLIECINGRMHPLKDTLLMKEDKRRENYSFLHERYGDKDMNYININDLSKSLNVKEIDITNLIKQIVDVEITESKLFNNTLSKLSKDNFKEISESNEDDIVKSLLSIFKYLSKIKDLDLKRDNINKFPILCENKEILDPSNLYFDKSYSNYIPEADFYAEELFNGIADINFISIKYMEMVEESNRNNLFEFLLKLNISPGIKYTSSNLLKIGDRVNIKLCDEAYASYNNNYSNFRTNSSFIIVNNLSKFSNKNSNLNLFWEKFINDFDKISFLEKILCNNYSNPNPFLWILNKPEYLFFPLKNGTCTNLKQLYSPDLEIFLKENENSLAFDLNKFIGLKEYLVFKNRLDNEDIVKALASNKEYENKDYHSLIIDHFNKATFTKEQIENITASIKFKCFDNDFRKIGDTIYLGKSLQSLPISLISKSNDLYKFSIDSLDYNEGFKNKLTVLGIIVIEDINLTINHTIEEIESDSIIDEIRVVIDEYFNDIIIVHDISEIECFFSSFDFIQCSNIELTFNNYSDFSEPVNFYVDDDKKQLLYTDELTLIDVLCEKFGIKNANKTIIKRKLNNHKLRKNRNNEDTVNEDTQNDYKNSNEFSSTEIETLKKIIGGELTEELSSQKEANFSSSLKGLLELDSIGFSPKSPEEFRNTNVKSFKNNLGAERKIIFRSAVKGLLYLDPYSWKLLGTDNIEIWIYIGHNNFKTIHFKIDLLNMPYNPYTLIRVDNKAKDIDLVNDLMENATIDSTKLLFITNQEMAEKLNIDIFINENNPITKSINVNVENYLP